MALLRSRLALLLLAAALAVPFAAPGHAQGVASESDVKAAFLYNFTKFVEWPPSGLGEGGTLNLCVLGEDPFGRTLRDLVEGEKGRKLKLQKLEALGDPAACQVLFVSRSEKERMARILAAVRDAPVLTVADTPGFLDRGGVINFVLEGSKVRFEIDPRAAERAGIQISSKLLRLARPKTER